MVIKKGRDIFAGGEPSRRPFRFRLPKLKPLHKKSARNNEKRAAQTARTQATQLASEGDMFGSELAAHQARTDGARSKEQLCRFEHMLAQAGRAW